MSSTMQEALRNAGARKSIAESEKQQKAAAKEQVATSGDPKVMRGKVKWFMVSKGYGFIVDENGNDVFVHFTGINNGRIYKSLDEGDEVEFEIV